MSSRIVDLGPKLRSAQIARLQRRMVEDQEKLLGLLQEDELVARAAFAGEVAVIEAAAPAPPPPRRRRRRRRPISVAPGTTEQDITGTRRALKQKGMLGR